MNISFSVRASQNFIHWKCKYFWHNVLVAKPSYIYTILGKCILLSNFFLNLFLAICNPACQHGGTCTRPDTCSCPAGQYTGPNCDQRNLFFGLTCFVFVHCRFFYVPFEKKFYGFIILCFRYSGPYTNQTLCT